MKSIVFILFAIFLGISVYAEEVIKKYEKDYQNQKAQVEIRVSQKKISVAESLTLKLTVIVPAGLNVKLPDARNLGFSYEFLSRSNRFRPTDISEIKKNENADGTTTISQSYTLEPWLSNDYAIPPVLFSFYKKDLKTPDHTNKPELLIITEGIRITVEAIPPSDRKLSDLLNQAEIKNENLVERIRRDEDKSQQEKAIEKNRNKDEKKLLENKKFPWKLISITAIVIMSLLAIYYYLKKKGISLFSKKAEPAHIIAYRRIEELLKLGYVEKGMLKEFYYELSYILREYIGNRFFLYAVNQTSEEFLVAIAKNSPFDKNSENDLHSFNDTADTAKYSQHAPQKEQANLSLEFARAFIGKTLVKEDEVKK